MKRLAIFFSPIAIFCAAFLFISCSSKKQQPQEEAKAPVAVSSIAVLPAAIEKSGSDLD